MNVGRFFSRGLCTGRLLHNKRLEGKVAIVTASTEGIGYAIAKKLLSEGAKVTIGSRRPEKVEAALESLDSPNVIGVPCHVGKASDRRNLLERTLETFGGQLDILVSNAAVNPTFGPTLDTSEDAWDKIMDINVKVPFLLAKEMVPSLNNSPDPSIIFISSIAGYVPMPMLGPYSISKTALISLSKTLSNELGPQGIRVNCVAPGIVKTKFASALTDNDSIAKMALANIPLKRFAVPDEISGIVAFLASKDASYMTGETIVASGGMPSRI
ncbi:DHRS4 [Lepeophtheirus salmonis]|uniref:DHRS4 n=2 Tax=Lepeophtheirus salmonis TaxID=72036 RepID=A0A7R8CKK2_LEPSM|nr:dehydrogenase/reductase SDR family member 4-like [Lepeophtheirus salmonis]CAB4059471.1 DHRS4 [Lepeophtheirus salmonis]CAF2849353.1 DHRS4 [Lepeophtheirus salmonis]